MSNRQSAGSKVAGINVGGQFKASEHSLPISPNFSVARKTKRGLQMLDGPFSDRGDAIRALEAREEMRPDSKFELVEQPARATFKRYVDDATTTSEQELHARGGQGVQILGLLDPSTYDREEVGDMYRIRFEDGYEAEAFADELEGLTQ